MIDPQELRQEIEVGLRVMFSEEGGDATLWTQRGIDGILAVIEREKKAAVEEVIMKLDDLSHLKMFLGGRQEYEGYREAIRDLKTIDEPRAFI